MRKFLTLALALMPTLFFAQSAFDKFEKDTEITSLVVGKKTFSIMADAQSAKANDKMKAGLEMVDQIESLKVFTTTNAASASEMKTAVAQYSKSAGLEDLIQVNDKGKRINIRIKEGAKENTVTEILVFVDANGKKEETILVLVTGNFDLDRISEILDTKTVSGDQKADEKQFDQLKKALQFKVSPNPATDVFYIDAEEPAQVKIYDLNGRLVKEQTYDKSGVKVSGLTPATYVVEITTGDRRQTERIIIK